jgi:Peptidase C10 family/Spi protease inhibitor
MKKRNLKFAMVLSTLTVLIFSSCQKTGTVNQDLPIESLVTKEVAFEVAKVFDAKRLENNDKTVNFKNTVQAVKADGSNEVLNEFTFYDKNKIPAFYVVNLKENLGFVIVSGDYNLRPVLAYIDKGIFDNKNVPEGFKDWINKTTENIEVVRAGLYDNKKEASLAWNRYIKESNVTSGILLKPAPIEPDPCNPPPEPSTITVGPLLTSTWGQSCTYNNLCALNQNFNCTNCNLTNVRPVTGCVATAMAQVIGFHQFPNNYAYATMPTNQGNNAVQQVMRDAGNSVPMNYGCASSGVPTSQISSVATAYKNTFGYSSANFWNYSNTSYNQGYGRVRDNIFNYHWPVLLAGQDVNNNSAGHMWVCDGASSTTYYFCPSGGYNTSASYLMFHMNWGWHEEWMNGTSVTDFNGWFAFDNWNIPGANLNFYYAKKGISEIHP